MPLGFGLLVGQKEHSEDVTLESDNVQSAFHNLFFLTV